MTTLFSNFTSMIRRLFFFVLGLVLLFFLFHYAGNTLKSPSVDNTTKTDKEQIKKTYSKLLLNEQIQQDDQHNQNPKHSDTEEKTDPLQ
jgi:hypothetical protein